MAVGWDSCGGLGGNARFTMVSRVLSPKIGCAAQDITYHLREIFKIGELEEAPTCKEFLQVQIEGGRCISRTQKFYNLDGVISVGYRVNLTRDMKFRQWYPSRKRGSRFVASQAERKRVPSQSGFVHNRKCT